MQTLLSLVYESFPSGRAGVALLALRLFVGVAFILHGLGRIRDLAGFAAVYHITVGQAIAAKVVQIGGGAFLIVGFLTPAAGIGIAATMVVALRILMQKGEAFINPNGHSWEGCAFYVLAGVVIALLGPGQFSIDALVFATGH
jgi:putative oxidoreductase